MSLQNKKTQLLGQDETKEHDDIEVDDIFAQYGGGDDELTPDPVTPQQTHHVAPPPKDDEIDDDNDVPVEKVSDAPHPIDEVIANMNAGVNVETPDPKHTDVEDTQHADVEPVPEEPQESDTPDDADNATALPAEDVAPEKTEEEKSAPVVEDTQKPPQPKKRWETAKQQAPEPDVDTESNAHPHAVAPVTQNYNSVMEGNKPAQKTKPSHVPQPDTAQKEPPKRDIKIDPTKKTILIVDDDVDTLDMYADVFEHADYNVIRAIDGLDALNAIAQHTPNLIFTGIVMPRMDGFTMMESLKQNEETADIPIVINSHLGRAQDKEKAEALGAKDFIVRGFTPPREALERIGALLMRSEYVFHFDHTDEGAKRLLRDLGDKNFFTCPRSQEMVMKLSIVDPQKLTFTVRFSCVDKKDKK